MRLAILGLVLAVVCYTDLKNRIIPDKVLLIGWLADLAYLLYTGQRLLLPALGAVCGFLPFFIGMMLSKPGEEAGGGDVKLLTLIGWVLGPQMVAWVAILSCIPLFVVALAQKLRKERKMIPMAPFFAFGVVAVTIITR